MGSNEDRNYNLYHEKSSDLTGKIMLATVVILFFVVIVLIFLHLYARWYLRRARRRLRHRRRAHLVIYVDPIASEVSSRGLDPSVVQSLPVFVYSSETRPHSDPVECAVCLSEFEENESGRILPKCNHTFHAECIDVWFQSHSTCPLCRSMVEPALTVDRTGPEVVIDICEPAGPEPASATGLTAGCGDEENRTGPTLSSSLSSIGLRRKPSSLAGVAVEMSASRSFGKEGEASGCGSPSSFRSPKSRMLSFKRILSRERKASLSPSSESGVEGCSTVAITELDRERVGRDES